MLRPVIIAAVLATGISLVATGNLGSAPISGAAVVDATNQLSPLEQAKKGKPKWCYKFDQSGRKIRYFCSSDPTQEQEAAAYERMKAQRKPGPTTQTCRMVRGELVCN